MTLGDIFFARFPVDTDVNALADTAFQPGVIGLFPPNDFDIISTELVQIGGDNGVFKNVIVVVARQIA